MSMPLSLEWCIITHGEEMRVEEKENTFTLKLDGYQLFPIDQFIDIKRTDNAEQIGTAKVVEMSWFANTTVITYELISLYNVN
ncbi:DUF2584 family protein [Pontibacillus yanchengensis]|uniref:DUF2584 family protein n=1 Tax=Pontibacillus yanchengensis TaxID=462910 RepID=A0ACC7VAW1_9BACI|nr:DUF2584 family protein [Pontibacillus yanchengensis]MYL51742.1 DUF2584 family protein [Pontibacillus yanchengensis]